MHYTSCINSSERNVEFVNLNTNTKGSHSLASYVPAGEEIALHMVSTEGVYS